MSEISLTASMRSSLLSLQNIASRQDIVQNRLATGLKVSSAIDNPSSYYAASSLNNRAADLTALLDAMSQGIQTIKAASEAIDSGTKFLEQAKAVANQALETAQPVIARVSSEAELLAAVDSGQRGLIVLENDIVMSENQQIKLHDGQSLVGNKYINKSGEKAQITFNFTNKSEATGIDLAEDSMLSDLIINYSSTYKTNYQNFNAVRNMGHNVSLNNIDISVQSNDDSTNFISAIYTEGGSINLKGTINLLVDSGSGRNGAGFFGDGIIYQRADSQLNITTKGKVCVGIHLADKHIFNGIVNITTHGQESYAFYGGNNRINGLLNIQSSQTLAALSSEFEIYGVANIRALAGISGKINLAGENARLNVDSNSSFYTSAQLKITSGAKIMTRQGIFEAISSIPNYISFQDNDLQNTIYFIRQGDFNASLMFQPSVSQSVDQSNNKIFQHSFEYSSILSQYDALIFDASYKGVNLLSGQKLKINFNEDRSSKIDVLGVKADSESLGLKTKEWKTAEDVEQSISELEKAINTLRGFASEFGNYYSIVTTRQDFTENLINVLEEGADKLTLADMNQESANMLALQTAQQLAVNSLSLASQASQAVLKLF